MFDFKLNNTSSSHPIEVQVGENLNKITQAGKELQVSSMCFATIITSRPLLVTRAASGRA